MAVKDCQLRTDIMADPVISSGPSCSKLMTSLVNGLLKFQMLISHICQYFFVEKMREAFALQKFLSFFFSRKNISVFVLLTSSLS